VSILKTRVKKAPHPKRLLVLLLVALTLSSASANSGVFVRFKLLEPAETSFYIQIGGYVHVEPWTLRGAVWPAGADSDRAKRVGSGTFTDWFDLGKYAGPKLHGKLHRAGGVAEFPNITANFVTDTDSPTRKVVIELATAPDERAVVKRFDESFTGSLTSFLVSPRLAADKDSLETASQMTRRRLTWAREASGGTRLSPSQLIVQTSFWNPQRSELNLQEAEVLWLLGFNIVNRWPEVRAKYGFADPGGHHWAKFEPNLTREDIDNQIRPAAQATQASPRPTLFNFSDEITSPAIGNDAAALRHFHDWLQAQNVRPADLGVKALDDVVPIESPDVLRQRHQQDPKAANRIFYYTARFRQAAAAERLRWLTESFHRYAAANILTSSLVADHPYFAGSGLGMGMSEPNMAWGGHPLSLDWFDLARQRAVDVIGIEDWMGLQYMYGPRYTWEGFQLMGFQAAIFRSGSRGVQPIIAWITPSDATNLVLKSSSALAQGAKHFFYWTYGPTATSTENYWSDLRGAYDGIVRMTRQLASAEHIIAPGVPRKTRVALLYSISADLWQPWGYIHMLERRATYLALVHDQYLVDMLTEEDVAAGRLKDYDVLYTVDPNISVRATTLIEQWVRGGGYLFGACGAASRDELNEPGQGLAAVFGIEPAIRSEVRPDEYRVRGSLNWTDYFDNIRLDRTPLLGEPAVFGVLGVRIAFTPTTGQVIGHFKENTPAAVVHDFGSGKAVYVGACPGLSYLKDAGFVPMELKERYLPAQRRILTGLAGARGVPRLVELSHPVVEAGVYDALSGTALILANFTYSPIEALTVRLPMARSLRGIRSLEYGPVRFSEAPASQALRRQGYGSVAVFTTQLGLNDIILLEF
jgi:hypothetical protein